MAEVQSSWDLGIATGAGGTSTPREYRARAPEDSLVRQVVIGAPEDSLVRQVVIEHVETFFEEARQPGGSGVPEFVRRAFYKFIECGSLAKGFARFRCSFCGFDRLVPFSFISRQLCPSCSGRRMTELSAHLVDSVFSEVPVRQWVLTLPFPLRYELAWNHLRQKEVLGICIEALFEFYREAARGRGVADGRTGAVTVVQRVGSALGLNPHFHVLAIDGVFSKGHGGSLDFTPLPELTDEDVAKVVATVRQQVLVALDRAGVNESHCGLLFDRLQEESPSLAGIYSASVQGRVALGPRAGRPVLRVGRNPNAPWVTSRIPLQAHVVPLRTPLPHPAT